MTITIDLSPAEAAYLQKRADEKGQQAADQARQMLTSQLQTEQPQPAPYDPTAALATLDSFLEQDESEHKETLAVLRTALDKDRPGQRRIFGTGTNPPTESGQTT